MSGSPFAGFKLPAGRICAERSYRGDFTAQVRTLTRTEEMTCVRLLPSPRTFVRISERSWWITSYRLRASTRSDKESRTPLGGKRGSGDE